MARPVNYWAERYLPVESALQNYLPFTSEDIDFKGTRKDVKLIAKQLHKEARFPASVEMTSLAGSIPVSMGEYQSVIEVVRRIPGVKESMLDAAIYAELDGNQIRVMDPISLCASKLKLLFTVSQQDRQDLAHLKIIIPCVRCFLRESLARVEAGTTLPQGWLGGANFMRKLETSGHGRKAYQKYGVQWAFLPLPEVLGAHNSRIVSFRERQLPHWQK